MPQTLSISTASAPHHAMPGAGVVLLRKVGPSKTIVVGKGDRALTVKHESMGVADLTDHSVRRLSLAREIYRRAQYQRLSWEDRQALSGDERTGGPGGPTSARALRFDGMTESDLRMSSPEDMISRYVDLVRKKHGEKEAELVLQSIAVARDEANFVPEKVTKPSKEPIVAIEPEQALAAPSLPLSLPAVTPISAKQRQDRMDRQAALAGPQSAAAETNPIVVVNRQEQPLMDVGMRMPIGGKAATSMALPRPVVEQPAKPSRSSRPKGSQVKPAVDARQKTTPAARPAQKIVAGATGSRIVHAPPLG